MMALIKVALVSWVSFSLAGPSQKLTETQVAQLLKSYANFKTLRTRFKQKKTLKDVGLSLSSSGSLEVVRPDRVTWTLEKPAKLVLKIGPEGLEFSGEKGKQKINTKAAGVQGQIATIVSWLTLDAKKLTETYTFSKLATGGIQCEPKKDDGLFRGILLALDAKGFVKTLTLLERSGDQIELTFSQPKIVR